MAYAVATPFLNGLGRPTADVSAALEAASGEIDAAFAAGGYLTPVDLDGLDATLATRLESLLRKHCEALAAHELTRGNANTRTPGRVGPTTVTTAAQAARQWLKDIRGGNLRYEGLPLSPSSSGGTAFSVIGTTRLEMNATRFGILRH